MTKAANPFALMVKAAGSNCNLRCRYCYYLGNDVSHHRLSRYFLSYGTAVNLC